MSEDHLPPPRPAPDPLAEGDLALLTESLATSWRLEAEQPAGLRERLFDRVLRSARASRAFTTVRRRDAAPEQLGPGVGARWLYRCGPGPLRAGEPVRVRILELAPGATWDPDVADDLQTEWLVMSGEVELGGLALGRSDFHLCPPGYASGSLRSPEGARVYLREARYGADRAGAPLTVRDTVAPWEAFAPGILRRVLWSGGSEAALLYHAMPGAEVPRHGHGHDEECLMLAGEVFLDDVLLQEGDYQLAPAGSEHGGVSTDTGSLLFAHGDLQLDLKPD